MKAKEFKTISSDLKSFTRYLFDGCGGRPATENFDLCVQARLIDANRKTHQPMGMVLASSEEEADGLRQRMNRTTLGSWNNEVVVSRLHPFAVHAIPNACALIVDDTSMEKKGDKSPGVARQYSSTLGKRSNCQVVVSTHMAGWNASLPMQMELFVPKKWFEDPERCRKAGIPEDLAFRTKPAIALEQLKYMKSQDLIPGPILADEGYGKATYFREGIQALEKTYVVAVPAKLSVWKEGEGPLPPLTYSGRGRIPTRYRVGDEVPVSVKELALELGESSLKKVTLKRGRHKPTQSRFGAVRIRTAHRAYEGKPPGIEEWLIYEWPLEEEEPTRYFLSNLPKWYPLKYLAELAKLRWRVERDYQDLKQEIGLSHYEGRRWNGFHHHLTICMAAMTFLACQRKLFPPQANGVVGIDTEGDTTGIA